MRDEKRPGPVYEENLRRLLLHGEPPAKPRPAFRDEVRALALRELGGQGARPRMRARWHRRGRLGWILGTAAAAACVMVVAYRTAVRQSPEAGPAFRLTVARAPSEGTVRLRGGRELSLDRGMAIEDWAELNVEKGVAELALEGAGTWHLGPGTSVSLSGRRTQPSLSSGRLYVATAGGAASAFTVPGGVARPVGTEFDLYVSSESATAVTVVKGRVDVMNEAGKETVKPGQQSMLQIGMAPGEPEDVDVELVASWRDRRPDSEGELLYSVDFEDGDLSGWERGNLSSVAAREGSRYAVAAVEVAAAEVAEGKPDFMARMLYAEKPLFRFNRQTELRFMYYGNSPELMMQIWNTTKRRNFRHVATGLPRFQWTEVVVEPGKMYRANPVDKHMRIDDDDGMAFIQFYPDEAPEGKTIALFDDIRVIDFSGAR